MRILLTLAALPLLAACQPTKAEPDPVLPLDNPDACGASKVKGWTGKADTPAARETIAKASGARTVRWITPGMPVTMDFRGDRLNANLDAGGRYIGFSCG